MLRRYQIEQGKTTHEIKARNPNHAQNLFEANRNPFPKPGKYKVFYKGVLMHEFTIPKTKWNTTHKLPGALAPGKKKDKPTKKNKLPGASAPAKPKK